ncbi:carboxyltransferase domain-containing protein [Corynebacterium jeikeium]|uniref:carboxyltransferase domain-containing protein n=1 Tax=Corynebacterium jeikeium TaxID=38289 RepID=UPI003F8D76BB
MAAARTVLVCFDAHSSAIAGLNSLRDFHPQSSAEANPREVTIDVVYDGEDLADVAELMSISTEELITRHTQQQWLAAFGGFAPGFTYCVPAAGDQSYTWDVPRRSSPRTAVPAGRGRLGRTVLRRLSPYLSRRLATASHTHAANVGYECRATCAAAAWRYCALSPGTRIPSALSLAPDRRPRPAQAWGRHKARNLSSQRDQA